MKPILFTFLLCLAYSPAFAQPKAGQALLDSLLAELPRAKPDTNRVKLLYWISYNYYNINPNEGINYANQSLVLARRLTWKKGMAYAYNGLGINYSHKSDLPKALVYYLTGLKIAEEINLKRGISFFIGNIGEIYLRLNENAKALVYFEKGLKIEQESGDKIGQATSLANIGSVYQGLGQYDKALIYQLKSLELNETVNFSEMPKEDNLRSIGMVYLNLRDYTKALDYLQRGLITNKTSGFESRRGAIYSSLGDLYLKIATDSRSTSLLTRIGENKNSALQKANRYADSSLVLAHELEDVEGLYSIYRTKSEIYDGLGEPQAALASFKQYTTTKDLIFNQANTSKIAAATLQYEFDKKETALRYEQQLSAVQLQQQKQQRTYLLSGVGLLLVLLGFIVYGYTQKQKANLILQQQKEEINTQRTKAENALTELRATQTQLIQKEKMASLGELTAGIAHEIQNPLNFVNNFSEVSAELVGELKEELDRGDTDEAKAIADDLTQNLQKIHHHGGRASAIVKGMLEHSRTGTGEKQPTNLNALADEYLKIAYHGLRAKVKDFNCELVTEFGASVGLVEVVPQEIGRVLLNLYNNAFYAVNERQKLAPADYQPTVTVSTRQVNGQVEIRVSDNGTGMPESVKAKIFQPFFTTKPTGEGTGLGLSLSYDIITKGHGGSLMVESIEGKGSTFLIQFPGSMANALG